MPTFTDPSLQRRLSSFVTSEPDSLEQFLAAGPLPGLRRAIERIEAHQQSLGVPFDFHRDLLPRVVAWAAEGAPPLQVLASGSEGRVELTRRHARHLLACALLGGTTDSPTVGSLNMKDLFQSPASVAAERITCLLAYFLRADDAGDELISFSRHQLRGQPDWTTLDLPLATARVRLHAGAMEESDASVFFDFANRDLQIHAMIPSATQEEVLFSACPEISIGLLLCERMLDDEVIVISGARRFCEYEGYLKTFRFRAHTEALRIQDVLAADAVFDDHFEKASIVRDLNKAWLGFTACGRRKVSTGHWGCGAFGGDRAAKFLQQVCGSAASGTELDYSAFRDNAALADLQRLFDACVRARVTVRQAVGWMVSYGREEPEESFLEFAMAAVRR